MRLRVYAGTSLVLGVGVLLRALSERSNFYSAAVFLAQSTANLMILTNLALFLIGSLLLGLQKILYGPLRPIETEQLYEKAWFAVTETCLAMTIFRGEVGGWFIVMFVSLLIGKVWGWIGEGRVEIFDQQPPANPRLFHTRLSISLLLSVIFNFYMLNYCTVTVLEQARPDMMVMFGFEFAVLAILSASTVARYSLSLAEMQIIKQQKKQKMEEMRRESRRQRTEGEAGQSTTAVSATEASPEEDIDESDVDVPGWEEKGRYVFYLDLATDFLKLVVYLSFFFILLTFYGLPIHIMRDVFLTIRSFFKRITDFIRYRNATRDMNERYPDATAAEISREDTCIICREEMTAWEPPAAGAQGANAQQSAMAERLRPKKLPCGHILHFACLRSWLERQQNCPTCRRPVLVTNRITVGGTNVQGQNNGQAGAGGGPGRGQGQNQAAGGNAGLPGDGPNRARVLNFGPFRLGFGVGRGNLLQDLAQQVHNPPGAPAPAPAPPNPGRAQQIGIGLGFGRPAPAQAPPAQANAAPSVDGPGTQPGLLRNPQDINNQLHQIETDIMRDIERLNLASEQLRTVRVLQDELRRLRQVSNILNQQPTAPPMRTAFARNILNPPTQHPLPGAPPSPLHTTHVLQGNRALGAGDPSLPPGMSIPAGWSLTPLQANPNRGRPSDIPANARPTTPSRFSIGYPSNPVPSHPVPSHPSNSGSSVRPTETSINPARLPEPLHSSSGAAVPLVDTVAAPSAQAGQSNQEGNADSTQAASEPEESTPEGPMPSQAVEPEAIPNWGQRTNETTIPRQGSRSQDEWVDVAKDKTNPDPQESSSTQAEVAEGSADVNNDNSRDKGKGKAATVDDFIDDMD